MPVDRCLNFFFEIFFKKKIRWWWWRLSRKEKKIVMHQTDTFFFIRLFHISFILSCSISWWMCLCVCVKIKSILNKCRSCYMWIVRIHYVFFLDDDNDQEMTPWILFQKEWFSLAFFKNNICKVSSLFLKVFFLKFILLSIVFFLVWKWCLNWFQMNFFHHYCSKENCRFMIITIIIILGSKKTKKKKTFFRFI